MQSERATASKRTVNELTGRRGNGTGLRMPRSIARGILVTLVLILIVDTLSSIIFYIPNAEAAMLLAVMYATYVGGIAGGFVSAVMGLFYTAGAWWIPGEPGFFSREGWHRMAILLVINPAVILTIEILRRRLHQYQERASAIATLVAELAAHEAAEKRWRQERDLAETLLDTLHAIVLVLDPGGRIVRFNRYMENLSGYRQEEIRGRDWFSVFLPESDRERMRTFFDSVLANAAISRQTVSQIIAKHGERHEVEWHYAVLRDDNGRTISILSTGHDITARERMRKELEYSNEMLQSLILCSPVAIVARDENSLIRVWNPAAETLFGWSAAEMVGTDTRFVPEEEKQCSPALRESVMIKGDMVRDFEVLRKRRDGTLIPVSVSMAATRDSCGRINGTVAFFRDLAELQHTKAALRETETVHRAFFNSAAVGMGQADPHTGRLLEANDRLCAITGYSRDELLSMTFLDITHPEDRSIDRRIFESMVRGEIPYYHRDKRYLRKDGSVIWVNVTVSVIRDLHHNPMRTAAVIIDITERRRAEEALRESETRFRQLAEHIREVFWIRDLTENRVLYVSPAYEQIWGRRLTDFEEAYRSLREAAHPDDWQKVQAEPETTAGETTEYRIVRPDGGIRWIRSRGFHVLDSCGRPFRIVGIAEDVTDHRDSEEKRIAHAVRQRDALVREVHHRIKNNIQAVAGLLARQACGHPELDARLQDAIAQIQAIAIVHGIQANTKNRGILLCEMCAAIADTVNRLTGAGIRVEIAVPDPVELTEAQAVPVALVLNELMMNAVKHSPAESRQNIKVLIESREPATKVTIFNRGTLIPDFDLETGAGSGVGLDLVRSLLPRRGARYTIVSLDGTVQATLQLEPPVTLARVSG